MQATCVLRHSRTPPRLGRSSSLKLLRAFIMMFRHSSARVRSDCALRIPIRPNNRIFSERRSVRRLPFGVLRVGGDRSEGRIGVASGTGPSSRELSSQRECAVTLDRPGCRGTSAGGFIQNCIWSSTGAPSILHITVAAANQHKRNYGSQVPKSNLTENHGLLPRLPGMKNPSSTDQDLNCPPVLSPMHGI